MNQRLKIIIIVIILVIGGFYFYRELEYQKPDRPKYETFFEYKILTNRLTDQQIDDLVANFYELKKILQQNPGNFDAWLSLASIKKTFDDFKGAEAIWIYAGEIRPKNSISFANLGDLYTNFLSDLNQAEAAYKIAINNSLGEYINDSYYRNLYELYYYKFKDNNKAIVTLEQGIMDNPGSTQLLVLAADFYYQQGDKQKAIKSYEKALKIDPENDAIKTDLAKIKGEL